ncbi:MAG TPA: hypothetical protein VGR00_02500 [Thermoanaerobaculia bacterium]|nr:hypothetical protein [Thermoanaerobaculia bacterium]
MTRARLFLLACLAGAAGWIVCETTFGLIFLGFGVRLWRYHITPLFSAITSPWIWLFAFVLITPLIALFDRALRLRHAAPRRRALYRLAFLMTAGPVLEVILNESIFVRLLGQSLYTYTVLPTFGGSGSLLSPIYYATLYVHIPVADRLLQERSAT